LEEAIAMQPGMACHWLLAIILLTNEVAEPHLLWDQFKARLCDDVKHKLHHMNHYQADQEIPEDDIYDYGLWDLNRILVEMGRSLADFPPMPLPITNGHLLICDCCFRILKGSKMQSLDSDKRCC